VSLIKVRVGMNQGSDPQSWHESLSDLMAVACICAAVCYWLWVSGGGK
jgi:hypothetical protein